MAPKLHYYEKRGYDMNTVKVVSGLFLIFLVAPILLMHGCGTESGAPATLTIYEKCENWANDTDIFESAPASGTLEISGTFLGGPQPYEPLIYQLSDSFGNPRNGVCVNFATDGTFYLDKDHTLPIASSGALTNIILRTDEFGVIYVYWATEDLPPTPSTTDETGETWVTATSGSMPPHKFTIKWAIKAPT